MRGLSLLLFAVWSLPATGSAQDPPITVSLRTPEMTAGDRAVVTLTVRGAGPHPLLVTPRSEGTALEVVRGRMLRAEAVDPSAEVLEFRIPVVARVAGAAVLRVRVDGYACEVRCRRVQAEAAQVVNIAASRDAPGKQTAPLEERGATSSGADAVGGPTNDRANGSPARGAPRTSSLSWVRMPGAETCPSSTALAQAVEARLGREVFVSAAHAALAVEGRAERTERGWRAVLHVSDADGAQLGERTLESDAPECDALGRLVALTVALMIDPLVAPPEETPQPEPPPPEAPQPEAPQVLVRTERVEVPAPAPPGWRVEIDVALVGSLGLLPTPSLGGSTTVIVEPPGFVPIALEGALIPFSRAGHASGHADFLQVHAGVQLCPLALRDGGLALHGCLGADAGAVFVVGGDVDERERVIGLAHAALRGHWDVAGPLTLRAAVHLLVPFRHEPFTASGNAFYAPEPIAGMLDLGVGVHF